jgi:hypothetical protein
MSAVSLGCGFALGWVVSPLKRVWTPVTVIAMIQWTAVAFLVGTQWPVMLAQNSTTSLPVIRFRWAVSIALTLAAMYAAITTSVRLQGSQRTADEAMPHNLTVRR